MKSYREKCVPVYALAISFVAISSFLFSIILSNTYASSSSSVVDEITIDIPASCSLTNTVGSAHTATIETGVYQENIGETTFKVFCNDSEGFAVYAVGFTNDEFGNNTLKPAVVDNSNAVATGTATSGNTSDWAMKLSAVSGTYAPTIHSTEENSNTYSFTSYHTIPSEYTKVASYSSNTDVTTGSSFKSTYAAFISQTQLADSYTGKVKYTVVHPSSELAPIENIAQLTYMQDFKDLKADERTAVLNSMQYNTTYNLIDSRDNKTYQIARLKDDNIWMTENLDLGRTELTQDLTSQNTNLSETVTAETFNGWVKTTGTGSYTSAELISIDGTDSVSGIPYGTLYNYCATSAGTICASSYSSDAQYDICPAGWRLPTGGSSGEFKGLYDLTYYNSSAKMRSPIADGGAAFAPSGAFSDSAPNGYGVNGNYWSSTRWGGASMYYLVLGSSSPSMGYVYSRYNGFSVRCIAKRPSRALTVSYGTGISSVQINGVTVQNGGVVSLEEGMPYSVSVTPVEEYALSSWTSTSGSIGSSISDTTTYIIGSNNATLAANAMLAIQNLDSSNCTSTASQVVDNRDGHVYTIQRLADGRCWMMENLDLGRTTITKDLTSANTNLIDSITSATFNSWRTTNSSQSYNSGEFIPLETSNTSNGRDADSTSGTSYGTLYNYFVASAGTISGNNNTSNAKVDICPARWRLPTGGSGGEFQVLYDNSAYNTLGKMRASVENDGAAFAMPGLFDTSLPRAQGSYGYYWSSSVESSIYMYMLWLDLAGVSPAAATPRSHGISIRCILDETDIADLTYMQGFNSLTSAAKLSIKKSMSYNNAYYLVDNRDNKTYQIAKLKDDNIWMAENLDLGKTELTIDLTSANTNLSSTIAASTFNGWKKTSGSRIYDDGEFISSDGVDSVTNTSYGTIYNYCAASAGSICQYSYGSNAVYDICPAGWSLPTGGDRGMFKVLHDITEYNSSVKMRTPIVNGGAQFVLAGWFGDSTIKDQGFFGRYWSSTTGMNNSSAYRLGLDTSNFNFKNYGSRDEGCSIRCVVK